MNVERQCYQCFRVISLGKKTYFRNHLIVSLREYSLTLAQQY